MPVLMLNGNLKADAESEWWCKYNADVVVLLVLNGDEWDGGNGDIPMLMVMAMLMVNHYDNVVADGEL